MCSIIVDSLWRVMRLGAREKFDFCFLFTKSLLIYDIATDFLYYTQVQLDSRVPRWACWLVLLFACAGLVLDCIGSCVVCCTGPPDSWGKDEDVASNRYQLRQRKLGVAMIFVEDIPQIALSIYITHVQQAISLAFVITVIGSILNIVRVLVLNFTYLVCAARAKKMMEEDDRSIVRLKVCGYTLYTYRWAATGYFGDMSYPHGGTGDIACCCCCC